MQVGTMMLAILLLAALVEALIEYFIQPWLKPDDEDVAVWRNMALRYSSAVVGVGLCLAYAVDLLALVGLNARVAFVGEIMTGLLIGRGANFVNDFVERWLRPVIAPPKGGSVAVVLPATGIYELGEPVVITE